MARRIPQQTCSRRPSVGLDLSNLLPLGVGSNTLILSPKNNNLILSPKNNNLNISPNNSNNSNTEPRSDLHTSPWSVAEGDGDAHTTSTPQLLPNKTTSLNGNKTGDSKTKAEPPKTKTKATKCKTIESLSGDLIMAEVFPYLSTAEKVHVATATHTLYNELDSFALFLNDHEFALNEANITKHFGKTGLRQIGNKWKAAGLVLYTQQPKLSTFTPLIDFRFIHELCIHDSWVLNDLDVLSAAKNLQMLKISYPDYPNQVKSITSLDSLSQCKRLRELSITHAKDLTDVSALAKFGGMIEELYLWNCSVTSLVGLECCTDLVTLNIYSPKLAALKPIASLGASLETVGIHGSNLLRDVTPLAKLAGGGVKSVTLHKCRALCDVTPLLLLKWECDVQVKFCELATDSFKALNLARQRRQRKFTARKLEGDSRVVV